MSDSKTLAERRGVRTAILNDLGIEIDDVSTPKRPDSTAASTTPLPTFLGTCPSPGHKHPLLQALHGTPARGNHASSISPANESPLSGGPLVHGDASHRSPVRPLGLPHLPRPSAGDASQRSPLAAVKSMTPSVKAGLTTTPPSRVDASQRSPATASFASRGAPVEKQPAPVSAAAWGAARASAAATRALATAGDMQHLVRTTAHSAASDMKHSGADGNVNDTDALQFWLKGVSGVSLTLSGEELAEQLRSAAPETYDD